MMCFRSLRALVLVLAFMGVGLVGVEVQAKPIGQVYSHDASHEARGGKFHKSHGHKGHFKHKFRRSSHRWGHRSHHRSRFHSSRSSHRTYRYSRSGHRSSFKNRSSYDRSRHHSHRQVIVHKQVEQQQHHAHSAGYWKRVYYPAVYETRYDEHGTPYRVLIKEGYFARVWVSGGHR